MKDKLEELINSELPRNCPKCGETTITLPGMTLTKEGSRWSYHTYYKKCFICDYRSNTVKIHGKFIHNIEREYDRNRDELMVDITPSPYGESILKRTIKWIMK